MAMLRMTVCTTSGEGVQDLGHKHLLLLHTAVEHLVLPLRIMDLVKVLLLGLLHDHDGLADAEPELLSTSSPRTCAFRL